MTKDQAEALTAFLNSLSIVGQGSGYECHPEDDDPTKWYVQLYPHGSYQYVESYPSDAIDELFWSDAHQEIVAGVPA